MAFHKKWTLAAGLMLVASIIGCPGSRTVAPSPESTTATTEDLLLSAVHQLRPENYTIDAESDKPIELLNSWISMMSEQSKAPDIGLQPAPIPAAWVQDREAERLKKNVYDLRDAFHIRDAMLTHRMSNYLASRGKTELQRITAVFDFVVRNVSLRGPSELELPLGLYHLLLLGKGSAEDRAMACSMLLRQLRFDCVVVQGADAGTDAETWLLGVVLNNKVYLFDPRLGLAIPSTTDASLPVDTPATLDQIAVHPEWLRQLALRSDQPYPIEAESLKSPRIFPLTESTCWEYRMKLLEEALPANDLCVLYDPLVDDFGRTGLLTRLTTTLPDYKADQLPPWPYLRRENIVMTEAMRRQFVIQIKLFDLPMQVIESEKTHELVIGSAERKMLRIRTDQLLGDFEDATKRYFSIRHLEIDPHQLQFRELAMLNQRAAEDAIYWSAVCKFEAREFKQAIEQLEGYLKRFQRNGRWSNAAQALLGDCHAELGQFQAAASALERSTQSDDPYRTGNVVRARRWRARASKSAAKAE